LLEQNIQKKSKKPRHSEMQITVAAECQYICTLVIHFPSLQTTQFTEPSPRHEIKHNKDLVTIPYNRLILTTLATFDLNKKSLLITFCFFFVMKILMKNGSNGWSTNFIGFPIIRP
jgi:hypothetical protein